MSFEEIGRSSGGLGESPVVHDKTHKKRKDKTGKRKDKETLISNRDEVRGTPTQYAEKDYIKSAGVGRTEGYKSKPYIEVIEETPSITGGLTGMNRNADAPPLISTASLRRFSGAGQGGTFPSLETLGVDQNRLTNAAKELKDAAWQRAMEVKDTSMQYAWKLGATVQQRLLGVTAGMSTWETYGRKKKQSMQLYEQAEQKIREARSAPADRSAELYLEANVLKQRALRKAMAAQRLAEKMKCKSDCQVERIRKVTPEDASGKSTKLTAWELYGHTKHKASQLAQRADELEREARSTPDPTHAGELLEESTRLRRKALVKSEEAQAYADGIKRAADDKVVELRQWAMRNETAQATSADTRL